MRNERRDRAADRRDDREHHGVADDEAEQIVRAGAEGEADAHLGGAVADRVREHRVDADDRQQERDDGEGAEDPGVEARRGELGVDQLGRGADIRDTGTVLSMPRTTERSVASAAAGLPVVRSATYCGVQPLCRYGW